MIDIVNIKQLNNQIMSMAGCFQTLILLPGILEYCG